MGDRWTDDMVDELFHTTHVDSGQFQYVDFVRTLKHGAKEKDTVVTNADGTATKEDATSNPVPVNTQK